MKRKIYDELLKWKNEDIKTPLMILGARQIGKTYIVKEFCEKEFKHAYYDFDKAKMWSDRVTLEKIPTGTSSTFVD